ncbi:hypothetical protein [Paenibacillus ginsengihumi]|jgi:hypothetical protein|uniref:hypothetical protein n=1 Tax=Paenibacillus ginsengihumi TaxID=431596 RepID=UPI00036E2957|nr:hypothetical protein [Paenibacillus ginsengihumi]
MPNRCQKIVRVQDGQIKEIYDGLVYRSFTDNDRALKELLMDDIGLDFYSILQTYESLICELSRLTEENRQYIESRLPEGWLEWASEVYSQDHRENAARFPSSIRAGEQSV